ncbi:complement component C1q receptor [Channa argus]|uniref:complement component C1q receptor n=1 Tax=Channa argus TaxID=215402 RepID=UPI003521C489
MVCSKLIMRMSVLMSVLFLWSVKTEFGTTGTCRPICTGRYCITVIQDRVDFKTAEETCHDKNGELMTFQLQTDESTLDILSQEFLGHFWIGLRLPAGACSNLSASLRGYEWTSGSRHKSSIPSSNPWKDSVKVCSPQCVSLSNDHKWTERPCTDKIDGFLCRTKHKDACKEQALADPNIFLSSETCLDSPCEQDCTDVRGGYKCSCLKGYAPDKKDLRRCVPYCGQEKCPVICEKNPVYCYCPEGFLMNDKFCEDIDECSMDYCDHNCSNTYGSFVCACKEGYVLKKQVKCIKAESESFDITTNNTLKASSVSAGGFVWIWVFVTGAVVVLIFGIRFYIVKRLKLREQSSNQQSTAAAPGNNIECLISSKQ